MVNPQNCGLTTQLTVSSGRALWKKLVKPVSFADYRVIITHETETKPTVRPQRPAVFIEYFPDGSDDCPLILLHGREPEVAARLLEQVAALASSQTERIAVHELPGFESVDRCQLFLSVGDYDKGIQPTKAVQTFECQLRPVTWHCVEGLLEPFAERTFYDGFQWLDSHGTIQLLISGHRGW